MFRKYPDDSKALHIDIYELSMLQTYFEKGIQRKHAIFEVFFRDMPFKNGFAVFAGLQHIINYIENLYFSESDIAYLRETDHFSYKFLDYLKNLHFKGTIRSAVEGELVYNHEPILQVEGALEDCQLVETAILNIVNFQTLIATKAARIRSAAGTDAIIELGTRRAQEFDAAIWGTRAAYIGGFNATSNVRASKLFGIPISGTHAHSLVQTYGNDYEAFKAYAESHHDCVFLVDTYDTVKSGVPSAIRVAREMGNNINFQGVRIDSGDMAYLSKQVREQLDEAGFKNVKIYASNDLDEETIMSLKRQNSKIDVWGVGTKLITAFDNPSLGAVYKMVAIDDENGQLKDTIKLSNNADKMSTPGRKQVWRITRKSNGKSEGDYVALFDEDPQSQSSLYMFHPKYTYIHKTVENFVARPILQIIYLKGRLVYHQPILSEIRKLCMDNKENLWPEYKRDLNPQKYPIDLSQNCWDNKMNLIKNIHEYVQNISY